MWGKILIRGWHMKRFRYSSRTEKNMDFKKAETFIYRNARPLDLARWQFLFENGSKEEVLRILAAYQNEDGGFGHGLEADCLNPNSSPIQTWAASEIVREVELKDPGHPVIDGILRYLEATDAFDGRMWQNTILSNNDYPHAPWWNHLPSPALTYNPTASLTGFIIRYANPDSPLYTLALRLAKEAFNYLKANDPLDSMHTVSCFVELFGDLQASGSVPDIDMDEFRELLQKQIKAVLSPDPAVWAAEYVCKPSLFIDSKESIFYPENKEICDLECEFITKTQEEDGTWKVTWEWGSYPEQWHISKNWWKSDLIIKNVKFYTAMQRQIQEL